MKYLIIMIFCISLTAIPYSIKANESDWSTSGSGNGGSGNDGGKK